MSLCVLSVSVCKHFGMESTTEIMMHALLYSHSKIYIGLMCLHLYTENHAYTPQSRRALESQHTATAAVAVAVAANTTTSTIKYIQIHCYTLTHTTTIKVCVFDTYIVDCIVRLMKCVNKYEHGQMYR